MVCSGRLACLCLLLISLTSVGADWRATLVTAQRLGEGEFTWFGLRLYSARLWAEGPVLDWSRPFALELSYHRSLSRETLVKASLEEMRRLGAGTVTTQQFDAWAREMQAAFVDVRPGMRITGVFLPQTGCRFYVDGRLRHEVADVAFARAFFAIWLDPRTRDPQLRQRLLGLAGNDRGH
ncbi:MULTISPECIES: chalcone isomerase family protein [Pseudomonas]|jgi:hypothetical protein|uniref:chalcone isomerase family protein n=1 Tax=Pseudomonas TaxID=286 RepID=UPI000CDC3480|nr:MULTISPECIES: chalcone isomerase family protein [Pseudomonas]AUY31894.1 hypothetical protein C3F42_01025 [Pseudomonas sp. PONIH3]PYC44508.1 hypothetical protein DMX05_08550 [Pseudomonas soli]